MAGMLFAKLKMTAAMALGVMLWAASAAACMRSGDDPGAGPQDQGVAVNAREQAHRDSTDDARGKAPVNPDKQAKQAKEEDRVAKELEAFLLAEQWQEAQAMTDRLLAGDRPFAARVLTIVLGNRRIMARSHIIAAIQRAKL